MHATSKLANGILTIVKGMHQHIVGERQHHDAYWPSVSLHTPIAENRTLNARTHVHISRILRPSSGSNPPGTGRGGGQGGHTKGGEAGAAGTGSGGAKGVGVGVSL